MKNLLILTLLVITLSLNGQFNSQRDNNNQDKKSTTHDKVENTNITKQSLLERNSETQKDLRQKLSATLRDFKSNKSSKVLFIALGLAFLYGIVHSIGPGHGKVFLVSQVIGSEVKYSSIVGSSILFAFLHSLSGLTLVAILKILSMSLFRESAKFSIIAQNISFAILIVLGISMFSKAILKKNDYHHKHKSSNLFITALMIGFVPCPGSIIIAVYAMKMGVYSTGVLMVLAMALGMAFTLILLNSLTLYVKSLATINISKQDTINKYSRIMTMIGSSFIIIMGTIFLISNLTN